MTAAPSWINKGSNPYPDWLQAHVAGKREPNGSFLIRTRPGDAWTFSASTKETVQARVLVGNIVLLHGDVAYTAPAADAKQLAEALDLAAAPVPAAGEQHPPAAPKAPKSAGSDRKSPSSPAGRASPRKQAYPPPKGRRPMIEWIPPAELTMDVSYQRSTDNDASRRLIASIAQNFDWRLCTPLVVSRRPDGTFAVIDGQHRLLAARLRGMDDLPCCVFQYDSAEEEAKMFVAANRSRKAMNRLDDFHAALAAGDSEAHQVRQIVEDAGLTIARNTASASWKPGEIAFTASIASTLRKHGATVVKLALVNIAEAFPDQKVVHSGSIFLGLVKVLANQPEGFDPDRLFRALLKYDAETWGSFVVGLKGGDTRAAAIRDALMMAYEEEGPDPEALTVELITEDEEAAEAPAEA